MTYELDGYIDVPERLRLFYARFPDGSLQLDPLDIREVAGQTVIIARAYAYRTPDDPRPGIGTAWEMVPGRTPYTRGSEAMNAETSAWGRAIGSLGIGTSKSVATSDEIRAARGETESFPPPHPPKNGSWRDQLVNEKGITMIQTASRKRGLTELDWVEMGQQLGWEFPTAGLTALTGGQAKDLLGLIDKRPEV